MKIDQIAYYCATAVQAVEIKKLLGLQQAVWLHDMVTAQSAIGRNAPQTNIAELQFNYDLGIELEIIRYVSGPNWHQEFRHIQKEPYLSHVGAHLAPGEDFPVSLSEAELVQETWTQSHTAEYLTKGAGAGRKYHYRIYRLSQRNNFFKVIKRIDPDATANSTEETSK